MIIYFIAPIPYMGGTAVKDISSNGIGDDIAAEGGPKVQTVASGEAFITLVKTSHGPAI